MELTLSEIAKHLGGDVIGDSSCIISGVSEIQSSEPNTITFLGNPLYHKYLKNNSSIKDRVYRSNLFITQRI